MEQATLNELKEFVERYISVWNEPDAVRRRRLIASLWSEDAVHFTESLEARGYQAIETRVTEAYEEFIKPGEYIFKLAGEPDAHHDGAKLTWQMVGINDGKFAGGGTIFFILGEDGRIRHEYQFN